MALSKEILDLIDKAPMSEEETIEMLKPFPKYALRKRKNVYTKDRFNWSKRSTKK